jgi:hypothetical protein
LKRIIDGDRPREVYQYSGMDIVRRENLDEYLRQWQRWEQGG